MNRCRDERGLNKITFEKASEPWPFGLFGPALCWAGRARGTPYEPQRKPQMM